MEEARRIPLWAGAAAVTLATLARRTFPAVVLCLCAVPEFLGSFVLCYRALFKQHHDELAVRLAVDRPREAYRHRVTLISTLGRKRFSPAGSRRHSRYVPQASKYEFDNFPREAQTSSVASASFQSQSFSGLPYHLPIFHLRAVQDVNRGGQ